MDDFDKVEKLRQRADVSYEEARDALKACDGDLLDAMVYLEKLGHVKAPDKGVFSTNAEEKKEYENVPEVIVKNERPVDPSFGEQLGHLIKTAFRKSIDNSLVVSYKGQEKFRLPLLVVIILVLMMNFGAVVAIVISLFFDVRYSFEGKDDMTKVNSVMDQAGAKATEWMNDSYKRDVSAGMKERERRKDKQKNREERKEKSKDQTEVSDAGGTLKTLSQQEIDELVRKYVEDENKKDK